MKRSLLLIVALLLLGIQSYAQTGVAINATGAEPDGSAMLDVSSAEKGMLIPRMAEAQRTAIAIPATGLLVYQTDQPEGFYYFDGSSWSHLASATATAPGQMQYWDGAAWIVVSAGQEGQFLRFSNSIPTWVTLTEVDLLNVGDAYQGGIIAYFLQPGDPGYNENVRHGLIAATFDQSTSAAWGCGGTGIGGTGTSIGTGAANTVAIVLGCSTAGIAAQICNNLIMNGYSDWYLPSRDELNKLYINKTIIGGFADYAYWSSSEYHNVNAWMQDFFNGGQHNLEKLVYVRVRAVRSF